MPALPQSQLDRVDEQLRTIIHHLYALMIQSHDYSGTQTGTAMANEMSFTFYKYIGRTFTNMPGFRKQLIQNLSSFARSSHGLEIDVPSDVVSYIENGRNPDIYNREFVESAQQLNQQLKGRTEGYVTFRDVLAREIKASLPELQKEVDAVIDST